MNPESPFRIQLLFNFSSTLRTLSSIVCPRSVRVPNRMFVEIRGTPCVCSASWHRFTAAKT
jgi:hypothetical protein